MLRDHQQKRRKVNISHSHNAEHWQSVEWKGNRRLSNLKLHIMSKVSSVIQNLLNALLHIEEMIDHQRYAAEWVKEALIAQSYAPASRAKGQGSHRAMGEACVCFSDQDDPCWRKSDDGSHRGSEHYRWPRKDGCIHASALRSVIHSSPLMQAFRTPGRSPARRGKRGSISSLCGESKLPTWTYESCWCPVCYWHGLFSVNTVKNDQPLSLEYWSSSSMRSKDQGVNQQTPLMQFVRVVRIPVSTAAADRMSDLTIIHWLLLSHLCNAGCKYVART